MSSLKNRRILKLSCTTLIISTVSWIIFQAKTAKNILENTFDLSLLNKLEAETNKRYEEMTFSPEYIDLGSIKSSKNTWKLWESFKFKFAQRLVGLCQNSKPEFIRTKAIVTLGKMNLDPFHSTLMSHMIDQETSISLARVKGAQLNLFIEPPVKYLKYDNDMLMNEMRDLLSNLSEMSKHSCLQYFVSKAFFDTDQDNECAHIETAKIGQLNTDKLLPVCLESLLHHTSIDSFSRDVAKLNALPLLSEIHSRYRNDVDVNIVLCRIISYLSFHPDMTTELYKTGWIRILAEWMNDSDIRISVPAAKTLANLEDNQVIYKRHLYLLHPTYLGTKEPKVDVVFVHGLLGGVFFTWRQRTEDQSPSEGLLESISKTILMSNKNENSYKLQSSEPHTMQYIESYNENFLNEMRDFEIVLDDLPIDGTGTSNYSYTCDSSKLKTLEEMTSANDAESFTFCWPRDWLSKDCEGLRIIGVNYDTTLSKWNSFCSHTSGRTHIEEQSLKLMDNMLEAGLGKRPVVFVTHSMGGLLVKNILCKGKLKLVLPLAEFWEVFREFYCIFVPYLSAFHSSDPKVQDLAKNTKGVVFYSTPHLGSNLATFNPASQFMLRLSIEVQDLRENSPFLIDIHKKFLDVARQMQFKIITFVETKKTVFTAFKFNFQLVTPESGNIGIGEYYEIPLDHLGICKPKSKCSFLYQKILELIREIVDSSSDQ